MKLCVVFVHNFHELGEAITVLIYFLLLCKIFQWCASTWWPFNRSIEAFMYRLLYSPNVPRKPLLYSMIFRARLFVVNNWNNEWLLNSFRRKLHFGLEYNFRSGHTDENKLLVLNLVLSYCKMYWWTKEVKDFPFLLSNEFISSINTIVGYIFACIGKLILAQLDHV